jgi:hypothetical protein
MSMARVPARALNSDWLDGPTKRPIQVCDFMEVGNIALMSAIFWKSHLIMLLAIGSAIKRNQGTGKVISGYRAHVLSHSWECESRYTIDLPRRVLFGVQRMNG